MTVDDVFGPDLYIHDPEAKWLGGEFVFVIYNMSLMSKLKIIQGGLVGFFLAPMFENDFTLIIQ